MIVLSLGCCHNGCHQTVILGKSFSFAASLEKSSEHPLAAAIASGAVDRKIALKTVEGFDSVTGKGVVG